MVVVPRPLGSFKGKKRAKPFSFSLPEDDDYIIKEAEKRAAIEGCNRSDIILMALKEYFRLHDAPNPQMQLPVNKSLADTISLGRALITMERLFERWRKAQKLDKHSEQRMGALKLLEDNLQKMAAVCDRTKNEELKKYVEQAMQVLKEEGRL